jgi:hypothetical protein
MGLIMKRSFLGVLTCSLILSGCADSYYEAQTREDAVEVKVGEGIIRVVDTGNRVEMIRKGYAFSGSAVENWDDFLVAGKKATGCEIVNLMPRPGVSNALVWVQGSKQCGKNKK